MDATSIREWLGGLDPDLLSSDECASLVEELARLGNCCEAARARLAAKAAAGMAHVRRGFVEAGDWLASATGTTSTEARRAIDTAQGMAACPATAAAWRSGEISQAQAAEIAKTEAVRPGSEPGLLDTARTAPLRSLKEKAQHQRLTAVDPDELRRRQYKARHVRHWRDEEGMIRISGAFLPEVGAALIARLDRATEKLRREARQAGEEESWKAHAADALAELIMNGSGPGNAKSDVVFVCDINAFRRGHAQGGEPCHVVDGGPVPVDVIKDAVAHDAFLKVAFHDGKDIHKIKHFGRHLNAELRTAIELGSPPRFPGERCSCGCGKKYKLQRDHIHPYARGGPTELANIQSLPPKEHDAKTRRDRRAGLC